MDIVLDVCDYYLLTPYIYPKTLPENNILRQILSLFVIVNLGASLLYIITATLSYFFIFDKTLKEHPLYLKNQIKLEIKYALGSIPFMSIPTLFIFMFEVRGYSKLYLGLNSWGYICLLRDSIAFIAFTDALIYWIHRWLHYPPIYKRFHKQHHKWKIPTPFASHAFHPLDGFSQSLPYHIYPFLFPLHKGLYLTLFVAVNIWTVSIHDGVYSVPKLFVPLINGSAHHTDHHLYYKFNYGQFFTIWDRIGGSFRTPSAFLGQGPLDQIKIAQAQKNSILNCNNHIENDITLPYSDPYALSSSENVKHLNGHVKSE